jgi:hypothetical protein
MIEPKFIRIVVQAVSVNHKPLEKAPQLAYMNDYFGHRGLQRVCLMDFEGSIEHLMDERYQLE